MDEFIAYLMNEHPTLFLLSILLLTFLLVIILFFIAVRQGKKSPPIKKPEIDYEYSYKYRKELPVTVKRDEAHIRYLDSDQLDMFMLYSKLTVEEKVEIKAKMREINEIRKP